MKPDSKKLLPERSASENTPPETGLRVPERSLRPSEKGLQPSERGLRALQSLRPLLSHLSRWSRGWSGAFVRHFLSLSRRLALCEKTRLLLWFCCAFVGILLLWAAVAEIDELARGAGQVVPAQRTQVIQNLEGGILREINVQEGQRVDAGDILVRIDNEVADSQFREATSRSLEAQAAIARLDAEISGGEPAYPPQVLEGGKDLISRQNALLDARRRQHQAEIRVLEAQHQLRLQEAEEQKERKTQLQASLKLAERQRDLARPLMQSRTFSSLDFITLEQKVQSLISELAQSEQSVPRLLISAQEMRERIALRQSEQASQNHTEINKLKAELLSLQALLRAGADKVTRTEVRSPVRGTVKRISITTLGGVIKPGESIMEIVPLDDTLVIEAHFSPADIAFLYPGQQAVVRLSAYDYAIYGSIKAKIEQISADTLQGPRGDYYYLVKLRTTESALHYKGQELPIMPGMLAQVDVLTGKKTVLSYLAKPLLRAKQDALKER